MQWPQSRHKPDKNFKKRPEAESSSLEQQMLELINAVRAANGLDPVTLELRLNEAAEDHSQWMLDQDDFPHTDAGGSSPGDRMEDAGFEFSGNWTWAENIAWQSERGDPGLEDDVIDLHFALMDSPGHRANILNPDVTVIGIGIEFGNFEGFDTVIVTQNFARTSAPLQLDIGAEQAATPGIVGTIGDDVLEVSEPTVLDALAGDDTITGSNGGDNLSGNSGNDRILARGGNDIIFGGEGSDFLAGALGNDSLEGGPGHDKLWGADGYDTLIGGDENDTIGGAMGSDSASCGAGDDNIRGDAGNDTLDGGVGSDTISGSLDRDKIFGEDDADKLWGATAPTP